MIQAGKMTEQITFESKLETVQPSGAVTVTWYPEQVMRAQLVQEATDAFLGGSERVEDRKVFRLWKCNWITTDLRLTHAGQTYRIARIVPLDRLTIELHCVNAVDET
jgi:SPP1 family predicted phage head-tail adaptor